MKTVGNLKDSVAGLLTGTSLDNVTGLNGALQRAARTLVQKAFIPEASSKDDIILYDGVIDYAVNPLMFGGTLNDLRPQGISRSAIDYVYKKPIEQFDRTKALLPNGYMVTFEWDKGTPIMRVTQTKSAAKILLDPMNSITGWSAGGTASTPVVDSTAFYQTPGSLRFNLTGAGAGYIEKTFTSPVDLTTYQGVGVQFLAIETPSATNLTSIEIRLGSDSANYYSVTQTAGFLGAWKTGEFLLVAFDLAGATSVGTPVITTMQYTRITINHAAALTNFRAGYFFMSLPSLHQLLYSTAAIFLVSGTLSNNITDDNDQIVLSDPAYTLYEYESALTVALQQGGSLSSGLAQTLNQQLHGTRARNGAVIQLGLYDLYRAENPSEKIESVGNWYDD